MTPKLGVLAKVLAVVVLLAAPAAARTRAARKPLQRARLRLPASVPSESARRDLRVNLAKRLEEKATPSIEPEWRRAAEPAPQLVAKR